MGHEVLDGQTVPGMITVQSTTGAGTEFSDNAADGRIGNFNRLVEQTARERNSIRSRGRGIAKETAEPCECSAPATLRAKPGHCVNCGGRVVA
jgi:hypothetical protein